jgi:hypothetical protein
VKVQSFDHSVALTWQKNSGNDELTNSLSVVLCYHDHGGYTRNWHKLGIDMQITYIG